MPEDAAAAVAVLVLLLAFGLALVIALRRRVERCAACGARLPGDALHGHACGSQVLAAETQGPFELVAVKGPLAEKRFPIPPQGLAIGRSADNDIVLADELMVSRDHAVITPEQGQCVLYDRDSSNGTWVNEERAFRHVLVPGDRVQIWQSQFVFATAGASLPSAPSLPTRAPMLHVVGEQFDGYYLEGLIGRGGMSEVFRARDRNGKTVAIKILQETNPYLVTKFVQEGNRIGPLLRGHPNIVYVYEFGQSHDNRLYLVMEFVDAPSLRRVIQRRLTEAQTTSIMGQTCSALAFAHQNNVVHRDIKPENILLTPDGKVKVLDFGIAKLTSASTVTTDKIVGTPEYISPEQASGEPVVPASDVYSLGIVLYEMLTGSVPFPRPRSEDPFHAAMTVIRQHLKERPEPIRCRNPGSQVSKRLERVTMRALAKRYRDRYPTAKEMGEALGHQVAGVAPGKASYPEVAYLTVLRGPRQGDRIPLKECRQALGRQDLRSSDRAISRHHVSILLRGGSHWLQDISKNGTWVDNQRVYGEIPLRTGAIISIGDNVLRLEQER